MGGCSSSWLSITVVPMIDVRNAPAMVNRLGDAHRRFEKGGPVPRVARVLLEELVDALAESGPLELGLTSGTWLRGIDAAERGIAAASQRASRKSVRRAKQAVGELKEVFGGTTRANCVLVPIALVIALFLLPFLLVVLVVASFMERYVPDARKVAAGLELPERVLFACAVRASRSEVSSAARARFGAYVHPVLIATDRGLLLARPPSELPAEARERAFAVAWEVAYSRVQSFSSRTGGNSECANEVVTIQTRERKISYQMPCDDGKALLAILTRRAPEVPVISAAPADFAVAAGEGQLVASRPVSDRLR